MTREFKKIIKIFFTFIAFFNLLSAQVQINDPCPPLVLNAYPGKIVSMNMPYLNRYVLIHFWSSSLSPSRKYHPYYKNFLKRYKDALYRDLDGFEIVCIAVQSDRGAWVSALKADSLESAINAVAVRGYQDEICKKFGITSLPADFLVDNNGRIIAINPSLTYVEDLLDQHKNILPVRKELKGVVAQSSSFQEKYTFSKLYLFNQYYDTLGTTRTDENGIFTLNDIKMNQDFIMKIENGAGIVLSDPIALYTFKGNKIMDSKNTATGFEFFIPSSESFKLTEDFEKENTLGRFEEVNVTRHMEYNQNYTQLSPKDIQTLKSFGDIVSKSKNLKIKIIAHASTMLDANMAATASIKQAQLIKKYFISKGCPAANIIIQGKGNSEPENDCLKSPCPPEKHAENQRVQIIISKN